MSVTYEFRVEGHLDRHWAALLGGLSLSHDGDGTSTLTGPVADQAQLHGLLAGLRDIGAPLVSLRALSEREWEVVDSLSALARPKRTERLVLRPARPIDAEATWRFRRLESVCRWLTVLPTSLESHRVTFKDQARLATTLVVELDGRVIGDLMLRAEDGWAQSEVADRARGTQAELGWVIDPEFVGKGWTRPRPCVRCFGSPSRSSV